MNVTEHQRPGVYSVYDASSAVSGRTSGRAVGVAAISAKGKVGEVNVFHSYEEALGVYTPKETMSELVSLLFQNGAAQVYAVSVAHSEETDTLLENYKAAFGLLEKVEDLAVVLCDSENTAVQKALQESVKSAAESRRERLAVIFGGEEESASQLVQRAKAVNCERVVLVAPGGVKAAAAVAGAIAGESDPAVPLGGAELKGLDSLDTDWSDNEIDTLVLGGVTPLEQVGGTVSVVRGITTRTKTGTANDATWRELTTIRVVDDVIPSLRSALRAKFSRAKNTAQGRGAIRSQVIVELESKVANEIITGYQDVAVSALPDDPTVCLVEFKFTVAHGLNQIWLSAHITV
ncbi:MAG: phage tail sheath subtilisin-like domain-containing protein [Oscillospiraceae bacterium]|nr:phage tail sheath subtilisin-like domain-containing protein [Oscillospiraceae bacterium]